MIAVQTSTTLRFAMLLTAANGFLDAYTFITRDGVFANVQTGNVILFAIDLSGGHWRNTLAHLWPILAFLVGVLLSAHIQSGRAEKLVSHPLRWTMAFQAVAFAIVGFVPTTVPNSFVTVPISFLAAMQFTLFRNIGDLTYIAVATTGNLMRFVEAAYSVLVDKDDAARLAFRVYGLLIATFSGGAVIGALASLCWGVRAAWIPAALLAVTLVFFIVDERKGKEP
ncbi:YoaK family protein [Mycobacterium sp.]|jgi:uncharacterized membrane protein YoaK (UPF0700 family)|uniref:YoaK family protein n=1 Tax=Mycobacterium sp. TaxID=1785 RepID=UPI003C77E130